MRFSPSFAHSEFQSNLCYVLKDKYKPIKSEKEGWWIATEVSVQYFFLDKNLEQKEKLFVHDLVGWKKSEFVDKPSGKKVKRKPDWVCEILSGNKKDDYVLKMEILHLAEVPFYWIVDPKCKTISVYKWAKEGYICVKNIFLNTKEQNILPFEDIFFRVTFLFGEE